MVLNQKKIYIPIFVIGRLSGLSGNWMWLIVLN